MPPERPIAENFFVPKLSTSQYLIVFFNVNYLALVLYEILGSPKFKLWRPAPPEAP